MRAAIGGAIAGAAGPARAVLACSLVARCLVALARGAGLKDMPTAARQAAAGIWQDLALSLAVALGTALLLALVAGRAAAWRTAVLALSWSTYAILALWLALSLPASAMLGSPLTWPMLAGAGPALADSVSVALTWPRLLAMLAVLATAALVPLLGRARGRALPAGTLRPSGAAEGPDAPPKPGWSRIRTWGLLWSVGLLGACLEPPPGGGHRNAVLALATTAWRAGRAELPSPGAAGEAAHALPAEGPSRDLRLLEGRAQGRNLIWVVLESTGAAYLRPYGAALDPMPRLTRLARGGIVFEQAYTVYPESVKGLYSLLCSRATAPYRAAADYAARRRPCVDLATRLRDAGYATALYHSGRFAYLGMRDIVADRGFDRLLDAGDIGGPYLSSFGTDDGATVERLLADLDARQPDRPFFVMVLPVAGHHPYESPGTGPRPFGEADNHQRYLSDLAMGDAALGRLIDGIEARGLGRDTLWVISGDHGEAFEQHPGNVVHSLFIYEENVRVPLIIAAPGLTDLAPAPRRAPQIASLVDVAPTILALLGLSAPDAWLGRSLLPPLAGDARFYTDHTSWQSGLRHGRWKYILDHDSGKGRLYDLHADPGETDDLTARFPERAARYRAALEAEPDP